MILAPAVSPCWQVRYNNLHVCVVIDVLTAYAAACAAANITVKAALTLPENWDGPAGMHLSVVGTVFTVMAATGMGVGAMWMLSNL